MIEGRIAAGSSREAFGTHPLLLDDTAQTCTMTSSTAKPASGNLLGGGRAEADISMLGRAFVETPAFKALTETQDFNFIVGRRGTGKSALFAKTKDHYAAQNNILLISDRPPEHHTLDLQRLLGATGYDYRPLRAITRLLWRIHLLLETADRLRALRHRFAKVATGDQRLLLDYLTAHAALLRQSGIARCAAMLGLASGETKHAIEIPAWLATQLQVDRLQTAVKSALATAGLQAIALYDGLDEGWVPDTIATAVIGGLALASADFTDAQVGIFPMLFIRDNMFRALAHLDSDFTRHLEGHTLRLHWDENSLFHLVAQRLRVALHVDDVENDVKVWNRFAHRELKDREGFESCLHHTLYRPRDILNLLNEAYANAARDNRTEVVGGDVEAQRNPHLAASPR